MNVENQEIREYLTSTGKNPFREWLLALADVEARARIRARLIRVRLGNFGDCKSLGAGLFELRVSHGPGYRVYFGRRERVVVILLYGGDKKTQSKDVPKAQEYWQDYQRRTQP